MASNIAFQRQEAIIADGAGATALSGAQAASAAQALPKIQVSTSLPLTIAVSVVSDVLALILAIAPIVYVRSLRWTNMDLDLYLNRFPAAIGVFVLAFAMLRLYPGVALSPVEELRRTSLAITAVYITLATTIFLMKAGEAYSRSIFMLAWALSMIFVPLGRGLLRRLIASRSWWGVPVVVLGAGKTGHLVVRKLMQQPGLGLKPVAVLDDDPDKHHSACGMEDALSHEAGTKSYSVPVLGNLQLAPALAKRYDLKYAIVAMPGVPHARLLELLELHANTFTHLIVIPDLFGFCSLRVPAKDLGGVLGLEMQQQLLLASPKFIKRCMDLAITIVGGVFILPLIALIALLIKLESSGPVFFGDQRIGRGGSRFKVWKFRSMFQNADKMLAAYLEKYPELRAEWEAAQKLKEDPRVTRVGRWLRKTSMDELPQLWNVLMGQMSLVGPRPIPIVEAEVAARYENRFRLYVKVRPGITGLWQVSGRNDTTYEQRVELDTYYVRNWSPWLDIHILARTVLVVLCRKGAY